MYQAQCLITGASGFLGKALCQELQTRGYNTVTVPRNFLWNQGGLKTLCSNMDYIIHLASYGNMAQHTDREEIFRANIIATHNLLEASNDVDYKKLIYVSSSSVTLPNQTLYSAAKLACEKLISAYDKPIVIIRPYSITGVGEQKEHLIPTLIDAAFTGKEVQFVPEPVHDFIDISDVVKELIAAATSDTKGILSLGSSRSHSNQDVLDTVEFVTGKKINIRTVDSLRLYDSKEWKAPYDSSTKTLTQSIKEMVKAYEER